MTIISNKRTISLAIIGCLLGQSVRLKRLQAFCLFRNRPNLTIPKPNIHCSWCMVGWAGHALAIWIMMAWSHVIAPRLLNDLCMLEIQVHEDLLN